LGERCRVLVKRVDRHKAVFSFDTYVIVSKYLR
jgi:hypothetical protein